jgi:hypothetical protein
MLPSGNINVADNGSDKTDIKTPRMAAARNAAPPIDDSTSGP